MCGFLALCTACSTETQPLNSVADGGSGGSGGSGGDSAATGGSGGSGGGSTISSSSGAVQTVTTSVTSGATSSGGTGGDTTVDRDVRAEKLDILFVVDNSMSMGPKQPFLARAAGELLARLAEPRCVDGEDAELAEGCPEGQHREFYPMHDMHVGVISSSIGSQGGDMCAPESPSFNPTKNDGAKLIPSVRDGLTSYRDQGFLAWDGEARDDDAEHDVGSLQMAVAAHITSVGETGCGYEMPLEAMYRFLVDPSPPQEIVLVDGYAEPKTDAAGEPLVDTELLEQRANFLRPDSALVIVMLSDEDDCSILGEGISWLTTASNYMGSSFQMPAATSTCDVDPADPCCRSCGLTSNVEGCVPLHEDPNCVEGRAVGADALALRCFDQKRRFGFDLLSPVERYVAGLTESQVYDTTNCSDDGQCPQVQNPLFSPEGPEGTFTRRASEVFVVSLAGVPWQDLATAESLTGDGLTYKSSYNADDWSLVMGTPSSYVAPDDPLMVASVEPRSGTHPITDEPLAPEDSANPFANSINGHEFFNTDNSELQYACIFPMLTPLDCSEESNIESGCVCQESVLDKNKALCQEPNGSVATMTQYFAGATPGLRQLELMSKLPHGVPASICPKDIDGNDGASAYGYNPAMRALLKELAPVLK